MDSQSGFNSRKEDSGWGLGLLFGGITLVAVLLALFLLNYFNILSLSEIFPKTLGWLPQKGETSQLSGGANTCAPISPLFKQQTAVIDGEITNVSGTTVSVKDPTGQSDSFPIAQGAVIYTKDPITQQTKVERDVAAIKPGKALISLEVINGLYQVKGITY